MKRNRPIIVAMALLLFCGAPLCRAGAEEGHEQETDLVVLLDVSQSVLPYFHDVTDYVVGPLINDFLRFGDTFHLLSFGEKTQVEIVERIADERDVKSILGRLYLLYPLARNTDLIGALQYLYQYLSDLPESRPKVIIIITDGVQDPPPQSHFASFSPEEVGREIESSAAKIRLRGWPVHIIRLPFGDDSGRPIPPTAEVAPERPTSPAATSSDHPSPGIGTAVGETALPGDGASPSAGPATPRDYLSETASALGADVSIFDPADRGQEARKSLALPTVQFPPDLGEKGYSFRFELGITNPPDSDLNLELDGLLSQGQNFLAKKSFLSLGPGERGRMRVEVLLPATMEPGEKKLSLELRFADDLRVLPQQGQISFTLAPNPLEGLFRSSLKVLLFILVLSLTFGLFIVIFLRRAHRGTAAPMVNAVRSSAETQAASAGPSRGRVGLIGKEAREVVEAPAAAVTGLSGRPEAQEGYAGLEAKRKEPAVPEATEQRDLGQASIPSLAPSPSPSRAGGVKPAPGVALAPGEAAAVPPMKEPPKQARRTEDLGPVAASAESPAYSYTDRIARPGSLRIELRVTEQNSHIGGRNIREIAAGGSCSVGGGRSDFLIFLVPVPPRLASLHFDGEHCTFVPHRPELFPELSGSFEDCLDKDIPMLSPRGYPLVLRFSAYEPPVLRLNRLLHCIETPGFFGPLDL